MECLLVMKEACAYAVSPGQLCSKAGCCATKRALPLYIRTGTLSQNINPAQSPGSLVPVFEIPVTEIQRACYTLACSTGRHAWPAQPRLAVRGPREPQRATLPRSSPPPSLLFLARKLTNNLWWRLAVIKQHIAISSPFTPHESFFHL